MFRACFVSIFVVTTAGISVANRVLLQKSGWTCGSDNFWYQNGIKSQYACGSGGKDSTKDSTEWSSGSKDSTKDSTEWSSGSKDSTKEGVSGDKAHRGCTRSEDPMMPTAYHRTCINGPPDNGLRCWWTYVPNAVSSDENLSKVPLVIDMHGGGGCASDQVHSSGFKELSDTLGKNSFITVWPQGYQNQWGTCGSDCAKAEADSNGKSIHSVDDLSFLSSMVATIVRDTSNGRVDAERIYVTGFSMGCMMSHRFALEHSKIVAGFGCHGGTLIQPGSDLAAQKTRFDLQPMPAYMTGGSNDAWFDLAIPVFDVWATWNGCSSAATTTDVNLLSAAAGAPASAKLKVGSSCSASVARLELTGGVHVTDSRMAQYTWDFLNSQTRTGVLDVLPAAAAIDSSVSSAAAKPTTAKPTTANPTTAKPTTANPTTAKPITAKPTTAKPTTAKPTTAKPTTAKPTTAKPTTTKPTTAKPTTTKPTTAKPSTAPPKPNQCLGLFNKNAACSSVGYSKYCEGTYTTWMGNNCALLCCETKSPQDCSSKQDANPNCPGWAKYCVDSKYAVFMKGNCAKTCCSSLSNKCADTKDSDDRCPVLGARYCTDKTYATWMQSSCASKCCSASVKCAGKSDLNDQCNLYQTRYCNDSNFSSWMHKNCAARCCFAEVDSDYAK